MKRVLMMIFVSLIVVSLIAGIPGLNLYYGNLHSHTGYSDGQKTPEIAFDYAKNVAGVDFQGVTDHAHYFQQLLKDGRNKYEATIEAALQATTGNFLAVAGFEWTATGWGHINVYDTEKWTDRDESPNLDILYNWIIENEALAMFNHPLDIFGKFEEFKYDPEADSFINLIEVGNGNWYKGDTINEEMFEAVKVTFAKGWHLGTAVNQDNHDPNWGDANDSRTAVYSPSLSRTTFIESLKQRRTYGTEDKDVVIELIGNGLPLGSILYDSEVLILSINIEETEDDPIDGVYLYNREGIYKEFEVNSNVFNYEEIIPVESGYNYYFVHVVEEDGQEAVSTPIWIQDSDKTYLHNAQIYTPSVKPGETVTARIQLSNLNNSSKLFSVRVKNPEGLTLYSENYKLDALEAKTYPISFTVETEEDSELHFYVNNKLYDIAKINVRSADSLNVIIDNTHDNFSSDERTILKASLEKSGHRFNEAIRKLNFNYFEDTDVFIMPLPGEEGFFEALKKFKTEDIELIQNFVNNGGTLVILGNGSELSDSVVETYNTLLEKLEIEVRFGKPVEADKVKVDSYYFDGYRELQNANLRFEGTYGNGNIIIFAGDPFTNDVIAENKDLLSELLNTRSVEKPLEKEPDPIVLIDVGHGNDYARNKLNDFSSDIDSWGYESKFLYSDLTSSEVEEASLIVLMDASGYSENEYELIKEYFENGGKLLITGKSDFRNESHPDVMNKFLEMIGSDIRINDDQIIDQTDNYGALYKVEIKNFPESPLNLGEMEKVDVYSGCTLVIENKEKVHIFAKGDDDTESIDEDGNNDAIPVDEAIFAAGEEIGNSKVVVIGKAIFSDYDYKHPANSNDKFMEAVIKWLLKQ
ncbi:MAG: CehA/McbA family metallohydrolase [Thermotogota bacterium]|nr:CehA/McbA family metallohydrolase [Thermotogota bacterium]